MTLSQLSLILSLSSVASETIMHMLDLTCRILKRHHAAGIKFPTDAKMEHYSRLIQQREPTVTNVIGFIDGLSIPVECSEDVEEQAKFYNGYHHDTMINNVFAFVPTGKIEHASMNFPGSWHDSQVAAHSSNSNQYCAIRDACVLR